MGSRRYSLDIDDLRLTQEGLLTYDKLEIKGKNKRLALAKRFGDR